VLEEIQADLVNSLDKLEKRQKLLDRELGDFPAVDDVKFAYDSWQRLIFEGKIFKEDVDRKNTKVKNLLALLNTRQSKLRDLTKDMALPIRVETYGAAVEHMRHYQENLLCYLKVVYFSWPEGRRTYEKTVQGDDQVRGADARNHSGSGNRGRYFCL
jgi:hypothetical protein